MELVKVFKWNGRTIPLSNVDDFSYSMQEIKQSKQLSEFEWGIVSKFTHEEIKFFTSDINIPNYEDFKKEALKHLEISGEISSGEIKDALRNQGAWITQKEASLWIKKVAEEEGLKEEKVVLNTSTNHYYNLYKENIKPDPNGTVLIL